MLFASTVAVNTAAVVAIMCVWHHRSKGLLVLRNYVDVYKAVAVFVCRTNWLYIFRLLFFKLELSF